MNFMKYSNETQINIIPKNDFEDLVREVFNTIATNLSKSLGPLGSSATILDGVYTESTKDGYSILKKYCFHNRYKKMIYNLIKAPCTKMNNTVGDGTTTAIALTNALFNNYQENKGTLETLYRLPRQFTKAWDNIINQITEEIKNRSINIDSSDWDTIYNIAYVVSNGNPEISKAIADVYKEAKSPAIKQKDSPTNKSYIETIDGFEFPANLISDAYVRNEDLSVEEKNVSVMIFDYKIDTDMLKDVIIPINDVMRAKDTKLIILAPSFDEYMCKTILDQYINAEYRQYHALNLIMAQYQFGKLDKHQLDDLAIVLNTKVINQELFTAIKDSIKPSPDDLVEGIFENPEHACYRMIGSAYHVMMSCSNGSIFKVSNDILENEYYKDALKRANKELEDVMNSTDSERQSYSAKIYEAQSRVLQLQMKNFIYYIGADSALQKQIIWDAVEDVIKCVKSAIKYGVVPGCQITIIRIVKDLMLKILPEDKKYEELTKEEKLDYTILGIILNALADVYSKVLYGPEGVGIIKTIENWNLYDYSKKESVDLIQKEAANKCVEIINKSIEENAVFDLETLEYNPNIITSAETDWMVLSAASELIKILISGNQCVFLDSEINDAHDEIREVN